MQLDSVSCRSESKFRYFSARLRRDELACIRRDFFALLFADWTRIAVCSALKVSQVFRFLHSSSE